MAMKLGIIADPDVESAVHAAQKGLHYLEYCYNVGSDIDLLESRIPALKQAYADFDLHLGAMGRWGEDKIDAAGEILPEAMQNTTRLIDLAAALGAPVFNTGVNYVEGLSYLDNLNAAVKYLRAAVAYGKEKGVKVAVYNCDWNNWIRKPDVWRIVLEAVPGLGIKYDPSHCVNVHHGDYLAEILEFGDRIYHFHIKGTINVGGQRVDDPPAGLDGTDWNAILGLLYAKGYDGMLSIEPHSRTWQGAMGDWGVDYTIDYISKMLFKG
ncbi:MAG: sugar phosphate isomerase/epimerase [Clostridia bacterium]|nr:sugar phosphate isomerase/epimerase [Clostridia bacterium]